MHMKNLGYMLLVALLLCCTCVQCSEKEHQTPPALSEGDDPGGDGGEENPEGLPGYPKGLTVDEFTQELANGSKCLGFYAIVDFKANPDLRFRPQFSAAKKPTAYFSAFAESGDGTPYLAVNGGFFGGTTSVSLLIDRGVVRSLAVQEDWIWSTNPYTHFFPVRAALGQLRDGSFEAAWVYCVADDDNCPYAFPSALGNNEKTMTFMPAPPTSHTAEENYWKEIFDCGGLQGLARHPRTAIGATEDGKLVIVVCDGRNKRGSAGMTLPELADKMISLGCVEAINLDGGGSSTFVGREGRVLNMPSDTPGTTAQDVALRERSVPTAVIIAEQGRETQYFTGGRHSAARFCGAHSFTFARNLSKKGLINIF